MAAQRVLACLRNGVAAAVQEAQEVEVEVEGGGAFLPSCQADTLSDPVPNRGFGFEGLRNLDIINSNPVLHQKDK